MKIKRMLASIISAAVISWIVGCNRVSDVLH